MDKQEILEKSRKENKEQDVYEKEIISKGVNVGAIVAVIIATIFFITQTCLGKGMNYGLYATVFAILAGEFTYKAAKLKRKHEILVAVLYIVATFAFAAAHIYNLVTASVIL